VRELKPCAPSRQPRETDLTMNYREGKQLLKTVAMAPFIAGWRNATGVCRDVRKRYKVLFAFFRRPWSSIDCPGALRCTVLRQPHSPVRHDSELTLEKRSRRCVFQVRITVFLWRKFSDHASGWPGFFCGIDLHRIMIFDREHDSGESDGT
jgi:hypothetical protein